MILEWYDDYKYLISSINHPKHFFENWPWTGTPSRGGKRGYFKNDRKDNEKETKNELNLFSLEK